MTEQNLFTSSELLALGFKKITDGGYYYYIKDTDKKDLNSEALVSNDMILKLRNPVFSVHLLRNLDVRFNRGEIEHFNSLFPDGKAKLQTISDNEEKKEKTFKG